MKTKKELREDFYILYGEEWLNSQREPDIDYVLWLENRILELLNKQ